MKLTLFAIGQWSKDSAERLLFDTYQKRLKGFGWTLEIIESPKNLKNEHQWLLDKGFTTDVTWALDERGDNVSSRDLANHILSVQNRAQSHISFLIGGADGLSEDIRAKAARKLAFGQATWPHMLVRPLLAEQLYRACTLLNDHPYHHG